MLKLLALQGLEEPLTAMLRAATPTLATCAGLILCAREVLAPRQRSFGVLDVQVVRNGYGRQIRSGTYPLAAGPGLPADLHGVFIRAPRITAVGAGCEVLATRDGDPVLVRQGAVLGTCFHPEMEVGHPVTGLFADLVRTSSAAAL
jgi:5'-phosphate synthase pdxT subunit